MCSNFEAMEISTQCDLSVVPRTIQDSKELQANRINVDATHEGLSGVKGNKSKADKVKNLDQFLESISSYDSGLEMTTEIGIQTQDWAEDSQRSLTSSLSKELGQSKGRSSTRSQGHARKENESRSRSRDGHQSPRKHQNGTNGSSHYENGSSNGHLNNDSTNLSTSRMKSFNSSLGDGLVELSYSPRRVDTGRGSPDRKGRPDSPLRGNGHTFTNATDRYQTLVKEFETSTIEKQRKELQVLIQELKERDRELNEMVASHQHQLIAWEQDRKNLAGIEEQAEKLQDTIQKKNDQLRSLTKQIREYQSEEIQKESELETTKKHLMQVSERQNQESFKVRSLEDKNRDLGTTVRDMTLKLENSEAKVHELELAIQSKNRDFTESKSLITELSSRAKRLEKQVQEFKNTDTNAKKQLTEVTIKFNEVQKSKERDEGELRRAKEDNATLKKEIEALRMQVSSFQEEIQVMSEREKRKDDLIFSQKSKQDRADTELSGLRQLYERQQKNLTSLQENLERAKNMVDLPSPSADSDFNSMTISSSLVSQDMEALDFHLTVGPSSSPNTPTKRSQPNSLPTTPRKVTSININTMSPRSLEFSSRSLRYENMNNSAQSDIQTPSDTETDLSDLVTELEGHLQDDLDLDDISPKVTEMDIASDSDTVVVEDEVVALVDDVIGMACDVVSMETDPMSTDELVANAEQLSLE